MLKLKKIDNISWEVYRDKKKIGYITKVLDVWMGYNLFGHAIVHSYEKTNCVIFLVDHLENGKTKLKDAIKLEERNKLEQILEGEEKKNRDMQQLLQNVKELLASNV